MRHDLNLCTGAHGWIIYYSNIQPAQEHKSLFIVTLLLNESV